LIASLAGILFLFPPTVRSCFDFGSIVDNVGDAVKSGMEAVEEGVDQLLPQEERREENEQTNADRGAVKDTDGSYYYRRVTFLQPMLITDDWGKLEISHTAEKKPIPKENITSKNSENLTSHS
jgi:hypothetical protein